MIDRITLKIYVLILAPGPGVLGVLLGWLIGVFAGRNKLGAETDRIAMAIGAPLSLLLTWFTYRWALRRWRRFREAGDPWKDGNYSVFVAMVSAGVLGLGIMVLVAVGVIH